MRYSRVLSIAGSDSGGGAGIQADLKTFSALGCFGMTAITAATAQNTRGVKNVFPLPAQFVEEQIEAVLSDLGVDAVKIGMLFNKEIIESVGRSIENLKVPVVLDPVMMAKGGARLLDLNACLKGLFPKTLLLTPNLDEVSLLLERSISKTEEMSDAGRDLLKMGARNVLVKGGHLSIPGKDCLVLSNGETHWIEAPYIPTKNTHGTGCTYSAAIAAFLARGERLIEAVKKAKSYLHKALLAGAEYQIGSGHGPLFHGVPCAL